MGYSEETKHKQMLLALSAGTIYILITRLFYTSYQNSTWLQEQNYLAARHRRKCLQAVDPYYRLRHHITLCILTTAATYDTRYQKMVRMPFSWSVLCKFQRSDSTCKGGQRCSGIPDCFQSPPLFIFLALQTGWQFSLSSFRMACLINWMSPWHYPFDSPWTADSTSR
jgi:hypothetical protein